MENLLSKIDIPEKHCEHYCIIGLKHYREPIGRDYTILLYSCNTIHDQDDVNRIEIFNFCPRCGQELNIETEIEKHEILKFKENK